MKCLACLTALALLVPAAAAGASSPRSALDPSFAGDGVVVARGFAEQRVTRDASGRLLAAALASGGIAVTRYLADGRVDRSFGESGRAFVALRGATYGAVTDLALQSNGKILIAASYNAEVGEGYSRTTPVLARLNADGSLDTGFGGFGHIWETPGLIVTKRIRAIMVRGGEIVVAGGQEEGVAGYVGHFHLDGSHDSSIGRGGWISVPPRSLKGDLPEHGNIGLSGLLPGRGGSYYATGWANGKLMLARFGAGGGLARRFGNHGIVLTKVSDYAPCHCLRVADAAADRRGRLLLVGTTNAGSGFPTRRAPHLVVLARYRPDGRLDRRFGGDGVVYASAGSPLRFNTRGNGVAVQPDGRIVVAGSSATAHTGSNDGPARFTVFRFLPNGRRDRGFFADGIFSARFGAYTAEATQALIGPGGRLVVAGSSAFRPRYYDLRGIIARFRDSR